LELLVDFRLIVVSWILFYSWFALHQAHLPWEHLAYSRRIFHLYISILPHFFGGSLMFVMCLSVEWNFIYLYAGKAYYSKENGRRAMTPIEYYTLGTNGLAQSLDNLSCPIQARSRYLLEYFVQSRRDMWVYGCYRTPASGRAKFEAFCVAFFLDKSA